jgi:hypothetical protein
MKMIRVSQNDRVRIITVIKGLPYYCVVDDSSKPGTWFFFAGVKEKSQSNQKKNRFILPIATKREYKEFDYFGEVTWNYIKKHEIDKQISIHRFGDLPKMCVSASLGGGFWRTPSGRGLNSFLKMNYTMYFLKDKDIEKYYQSLTKPIKSVKHAQQINEWLENQGVSYAGNAKSCHELIKIVDNIYASSHSYFWADSVKTYDNSVKPPCVII